MFEKSRLEANLENLTGLLLIKAPEEGTGQHYALAALDPKKLLSFVREIPQALEEVVRQSEEIVRRVVTDPEIGIDQSDGIWVYGIGGFTTSSLESHVILHENLDVYNNGAVKNHEEFKEKADSVVTNYFIMYHLQQEEKQRNRVAEKPKTFRDVPAKDIVWELCRRSARLLHAIAENSPEAQLEAEDSLRSFAFGDPFKYSVEQIIQLTSSTISMIPDRAGLIALQCRIIGAIAREDYMLAKNLHSLYENSIQKTRV